MVGAPVYSGRHIPDADTTDERMGTQFAPLCLIIHPPGAAKRGTYRMPATLQVLITDGDIESADALADAALRLGHTIQVAYDGATAISLMRSIHFDVAFIDIASLGAPGAVFYRCPATAAAFEYTCMIAMTADAVHPHAADVDWCDALLTKPVSMQALRQVLGMDEDRL
jgi:CheY-like chemotaxis protein